MTNRIFELAAEAGLVTNSEIPSVASGITTSDIEEFAVLLWREAIATIDSQRNALDLSERASGVKAGRDALVRRLKEFV
jgi:hypothetical protein